MERLIGERSGCEREERSSRDRGENEDATP